MSVMIIVISSDKLRSLKPINYIDFNTLLISRTDILYKCIFNI